MKLRVPVLAVKVVSLGVMGLIMGLGSLGPHAIGGLWACPSPIPFIMCNICPVRCTFGQIRVWLFYGILTSGLVMGRAFCGVLCPMGVAQELLFKIRVPKIRVPRSADQALRYAKYLLAVVAIALVVEASGVWTGLPFMGKVWSFLVMHSDGMRIARLISIPVVLIVSLFAMRVWCNYFCPIGTWISPFNRFSLVGLKRDSAKCITCRVCDQKCSKPSGSDRDEEVWESTECIRCLQCYTECKGKAFQLKNRLRGGEEENELASLEV